MGKRFESQNLEIFDLAAEELYRHLPATISHTLELSNTLAKKSEPRDAIQAQPGRVTACN
jgi:hypothetical protein